MMNNASPNPEGKPKASHLTMVLIINLLVLGSFHIFLVILHLMPGGGKSLSLGGGELFMLRDMFAVGLHCGILVLIAGVMFVLKKWSSGIDYLVAMAVVLAIGVGTCFAGGIMMGP